MGQSPRPEMVDWMELPRVWRYNYRDGEGSTAPENIGIVP